MKSSDIPPPAPAEAPAAEEPVATEPLPLPPEETLPIPAPPPSHPYRYPPEVFPGFPPAKTPRPLLGSALAVYGVLLWSFVVAGQLATSWITGAPIGEGTAALLVMGATGAAWAFALHRSRLAVPSATIGRFIGRAVGISALAFLLFIVTVLGATIFGQATHGHDFLIALSLVALSLAAIIAGPRLTLRRRLERTQLAKFAVISVWIVGVILTFVAGAELATNG